MKLNPLGTILVMKFAKIKLIILMTLHIFAAVTDIDTSGIHAFEQLYRSLQRRDVQVINTITHLHIVL